MPDDANEPLEDTTTPDVPPLPATPGTMPVDPYVPLPAPGAPSALQFPASPGPGAPPGYPPPGYPSQPPGYPPPSPSLSIPGPGPGYRITQGAPPSPWSPPPHPGFTPSGPFDDEGGPAVTSQAPLLRRHRVATVIVLVVALLLGGGIALLVTAGPGPVPAISPAAQHLLRSSLAATIKGGSFHYVSRFTAQGTTQTTIGDAGRSSGRQVITIGNDTFTVLVKDKACYFKGSARQLEEQLGLPVSLAMAHAGQWISLAPGDLPYRSVYVAVTTRSALSSNIAFTPHRESAALTRAGYRVFAIIGPMTNLTVNGQTQRAQGTASLYVTATRPHLPVQYTEHGKIDRQTSDLVMTFSKWGEAVRISAPAGAVAYSSLGSGGTTTTTPLGPPILT